METKKIGIACFIGGALCCAVALMVAPTFWWLGLFAGFAGGYIGYEFREVLRAVPVALKNAGGTSVDKWNNMIANVKAWLSKPHPFFYQSVILSTSILAYLIPEFTRATKLAKIASLDEIILACLVGMFLPYIFTVMVGFLAFFTLAFIGARVGSRCYWRPFFDLSEGEVKNHVRSLRKRGYREKPFAYLNVLRWEAIGILVIIRFFVWTIWKYLLFGLWKISCFICRAVRNLIILIHSKKRLLCAIDGSLGGAVSYKWLVATSMSFTEQVALIIFGGLLGAAFGIANWEIVSKRILHISVNEA